MSDAEKTISLLQARRTTQTAWQPIKLQIAIIKLLAQGKPISARQVAESVDDPVEFVTTAFMQLQQGGCEFNTHGELIGSALTLTPTRHKLEVASITVYAWCALDTLFLPAYLGKSAKVTSTCPATNSVISLIVTPDAIHDVDPAEAVVSVMTAPNCTAGIDGTFCGQVYFFASREAAQEWIGERPDFAILTVADAFTVAQKLYVEPITRYT